MWLLLFVVGAIGAMLCVENKKSLNVGHFAGRLGEVVVAD
jgi:hypothetical protein